MYLKMKVKPKYKYVSNLHKQIISECIITNTNCLNLAFIEASCRISLHGLRPMTINTIRTYWYSILKHEKTLFNTMRSGRIVYNNKN